MTTEFIEIDSTFRNKQTFPLPSNFEINSNIQACGAVNAINPIADGICANDLSYTLNITNNPLTTASDYELDGILDYTDSTDLIISVLFDRKHTYDGFGVFTGSGAANSSPNQIRGGVGFYNGLILQIIQLDPLLSTRRIVSFQKIDNTHAIITIDHPLPDAIAKNSAVRITLPDIESVRSVFIPNGFNISGSYVGDTIRILPGPSSGVNAWQTPAYYTIESYDGVSHVATITAATLSPVLIGDEIITVRQGTIPAYYGVTNINGVFTDSTFTLPPTVAGNLTGAFIGITTHTGNVVPIERRIVSYDPNTQSGQVSPSFGVNPGTSYIWEVLQYKYDNTYSFTALPAGCYEMKLVNLTLPNLPVVGGFASAVSSYPCFFVALQNNHLNRAMYSNNPNLKKMMFKVLNENSSSIYANTPFIPFEGNDTVHQIKISANDIFTFSVTLPDGTFFQVNEADTAFGNYPNRNMQITALFSIKKMLPVY